MGATTREEIQAAIAEIPTGRVFEYAEIPGYGQRPLQVARMINRMAKEGAVTRYAPGIFYRPQQGVLGPGPLSENERLRALMYRNGRRVAYVTGHALYNRLGLSSQVPATVTLATQAKLQNLDLGSVKITMVKARAAFCEVDIPALELLDALADIDSIQATSPGKALSRLKNHLQKLPDEAKQQLFKKAKAYPPATLTLLNKIF